MMLELLKLKKLIIGFIFGTWQKARLWKMNYSHNKKTDSYVCKKKLFILVISNNTPGTITKRKRYYKKIPRKQCIKKCQWFYKENKQSLQSHLWLIQQIIWKRKKEKKRVCKNSVLEYACRIQTINKRMWKKTNENFSWRGQTKIERIHERILEKKLIQQCVQEKQKKTMS